MKSFTEKYVRNFKSNASEFISEILAQELESGDIEFEDVYELLSDYGKSVFDEEAEQVAR